MSLEDARAAIGVKPADFPVFRLGSPVEFEFRDKGGDVCGFVQPGSPLVAQCFFISNPNPGLAALAFLAIRNRAFDIAKAMGVTDVELQAGTVRNDDVLDFLQRTAFTQKTVTSPSFLTGGPQQVWARRFRVP